MQLLVMHTTLPQTTRSQGLGPRGQHVDDEVSKLPASRIDKRGAVSLLSQNLFHMQTHHHIASKKVTSCTTLTRAAATMPQTLFQPHTPSR